MAFKSILTSTLVRDLAFLPKYIPTLYTRSFVCLLHRYTPTEEKRETIQDKFSDLTIISRSRSAPPSAPAGEKCHPNGLSESDKHVGNPHNSRIAGCRLHLINKSLPSDLTEHDENTRLEMLGKTSCVCDKVVKTTIRYLIRYKWMRFIRRYPWKSVLIGVTAANVRLTLFINYFERLDGLKRYNNVYIVNANIL